MKEICVIDEPIIAIISKCLSTFTLEINHASWFHDIHAISKLMMIAISSLKRYLSYIEYKWHNIYAFCKPLYVA